MVSREARDNIENQEGKNENKIKSKHRIYKC